MDQFRGLFVKLDQDKDGFVSVSELHSEMKKHGIITTDGRVQVIVTSYRSSSSWLHMNTGHGIQG